MNDARPDPHPSDGGCAALQLSLEALLEGALSTRLIRTTDEGVFCLLSVAQRFAMNSNGVGREEEALHIVQQSLASLEDRTLIGIRDGSIRGRSRGGFERGRR